MINRLHREKIRIWAVWETILKRNLVKTTLFCHWLKQVSILRRRSKIKLLNKRNLKSAWEWTKIISIRLTILCLSIWIQVIVTPTFPTLNSRRSLYPEKRAKKSSYKRSCSSTVKALTIIARKPKKQRKNNNTWQVWINLVHGVAMCTFKDTIQFRWKGTYSSKILRRQIWIETPQIDFTRHLKLVQLDPQLMLYLKLLLEFLRGNSSNTRSIILPYLLFQPHKSETCWWPVPI